jgi:tetratricopeptide (TPR) repeat protein
MSENKVATGESGGSNPEDFEKLWDYENPEQTELRFREILPNVKGAGNRSHYLQLLTQIARSEGLQRKFDTAHRTLNEVERLLNKETRTANIRYLLERGRVYNSSGNKQKASELFERAYNESKEAGEEYLMIDAAHMLAIAANDTDEALKWNETAFKHIEETDDKRAKKWFGSINNNIGWTYFDKGDYDKAMEHFRSNVEWHKERNTKKEYQIAKWCVARTLRAQNKTEEALEMQKMLQKEAEDKKLPDDGYIYEETGECLFTLGKKDEAKEHFRKAYKLLSKDIWLKNNENERLERIKKLSE